MILAHSLDRARRHFPDQPALSGAGRPTTFRELYDRVACIAAGLQQDGFARGDRLALLLPNLPESIELIYACAWLGVIVVPLNTRLTVVEIDAVIRDAAPRGLVRHSSLPAPTVPVAWERVLDRTPLRIAAATPPDPVDDPAAVLALIYTSGTTGRAKGVMVTHAMILAGIHHLSYWAPLGEGEVHLHTSPLFHIIDFPFVFAAAALGARQVTLPKFSARAFRETVARERVTRTVLVPTMIDLLLEDPQIGAGDLSSLEFLAYGGSPMPPDLVGRARAILPRVKLVQGYGLSEAGFLSALRDEHHTPELLASCGRTCPGVEMRVVDDAGRELPVGTAGELVARGANVMSGYWNAPDESARVFRDGFFRTGDIGRVDANGFFFILDRIKDLIVTGGENVYSGEVEAVLHAHPDVREAAVFGMPDPKWGEIVAACVVRKPGSDLTAEALVAHARASLAGYKVPRRIEFSGIELPKNGAGKILKRVLRERFLEGQDA